MLAASSAIPERNAVGRYDPHPDPFFVLRRDAVNLNDIILRCVAFIGIMKDGEFQPRATGFFAGYRDGQHHFDHLVTAEHVISGLMAKGHEIWVRLNTTDGSTTDAIVDARAFRFHPNNENEPTDVAVIPFTRSLTDEAGRTITADISPIAMSGFMPNEEFARDSIKLGADVAIVGLFRSHYGANRNVPIVRVGNISTLLGEPVFTKYAGYISAYLIEARSIAGLSGSPVFVMPETAVLMAKGMRNLNILRGEPRPTPETVMGQSMALLGLMHGHFDVPNLNEDVVADEDEPTRGVHTGIGVVVPAQKIIETIEHPELIEMRKAITEELRRKGGATADLAEPSKAAAASADNEANPHGREDFTRLVDVATRKRPQGDQT